MIQASAAQELCCLAEEGEGDSSFRRWQIFQDQSGGAWHQCAQSCLQQVCLHACGLPALVPVSFFSVQFYLSGVGGGGGVSMEAKSIGEQVLL